MIKMPTIRILQQTLILLLLLTSTAPFAAEIEEVAEEAEKLPIPSFEAKYKVHRGGLTIGEAQRRLYQKDETWVFESSSRTTGFAALFIKDTITERSHAYYQNGRMLPQSYLYQREGGKREREVKLRFDWSQQRVINSINDDPWVMKIPEGTLDKFLYQLQMMIDLEKQQPLNYQVADGGKLKQYHIDIIGSERLKTPLGEFDTVILKRRDDKRQTTMWCAENLHYLPLKITQIEKDGAEYRAEISQLSGLGK